MGDNDVALMLNLVRPDEWSPTFFASQFYYSGDSPKPVRLTGNDMKTAHNVYYVTLYGSEKIRADSFTGLTNVEIFPFAGVTVAKIRSDGDARVAAVGYLERLAELLPKTEENYAPHESLFYLNLDLGPLGTLR